MVAMTAPISLICGNLISTLVARRHALGLTQRDVAAIMKVSRGSFAQWECGRHCPSLPILIRWCAALDLFIRFIPYEGRPRRDARKQPPRGPRRSNVIQLQGAA